MPSICLTRYFFIQFLKKYFQIERLQISDFFFLDNCNSNVVARSVICNFNGGKVKGHDLPSAQRGQNVKRIGGGKTVWQG